MNEVRIYKPNEKGELVKVQTISAEDIARQYWDEFDPGKDRTPKTQFHRIGIDLKQCIEEGCTKPVEDARRLTCSDECRTVREKRQRQESHKKENQAEVICATCKKVFIARKDKKYCSKTCLYNRS